MNDYDEKEPFSRIFVDFWLGFWILIYGTPIIIKTIIGTHDIGFSRLGYPIWVIISMIVLARNLKLPIWKVTLISCTGIPFGIASEIVTDNLFYEHIFMRDPSDQIMYKYYVARLIQILAEIVYPIGVYIYVKIKMWQMTRKAKTETV